MTSALRCLARTVGALLSMAGHDGSGGGLEPVVCGGSDQLLLRDLQCPPLGALLGNRNWESLSLLPCRAAGRPSLSLLEVRAIRALPGEIGITSGAISEEIAPYKVLGRQTNVGAASVRLEPRTTSLGAAYRIALLVVSGEKAPLK